MGILGDITGLGRKKSSTSGTVFGVMFLFLSTIGLWVNEGRSVDQMDALYEMQTAITIIGVRVELIIYFTLTTNYLISKLFNWQYQSSLTPFDSMHHPVLR